MQGVERQSEVLGVELSVSVSFCLCLCLCLYLCLSVSLFLSLPLSLPPPPLKHTICRALSARARCRGSSSAMRSMTVAAHHAAARAAPRRSASPRGRSCFSRLSTRTASAPRSPCRAPPPPPPPLPSPLPSSCSDGEVKGLTLIRALIRHGSDGNRKLIWWGV
jgi:hypothetical protein